MGRAQLDSKEPRIAAAVKRPTRAGFGDHPSGRVTLANATSWIRTMAGALWLRQTEAEVWYAAYGSNLDVARFRLYLEGGAPRPGARAHERCPSGVAIIDVDQYTTNHPLYFAGHSAQWGGGGVAFVGLAPQDGERTLCRAYRLRLAQFEHVVSEENGGRQVALPNNVLLADTVEVRDTGWYRIVVRLGSHRRIPVLTVTGVSDEIGVRNRPVPEYLHHIRVGLHQTYPDLTEPDVDAYLAAAELRDPV
jgi:hypothetical protein